jgi:hypothetical protein
MIAFAPRMFRLLLVAVLATSAAVELGSETLTMSTTYPSPAGIYKTIITTDNTTLARDKSGSMVNIGGGGNTSATLNVNGNAVITNNLKTQSLTLVGNLGLGTDASVNQAFTISSSTSSKILLTGGNSQNGMVFDAVGGANPFYLYTGAGVGPIAGNAGFGVYNMSNGKSFMVSNGGALVFPDGTSQTTAATAGSVPNCRWSSSWYNTGSSMVNLSCPSGWGNAISLQCFSTNGTHYSSGWWLGVTSGTCYWPSPPAAGDSLSAMILCCTGINVAYE